MADARAMECNARLKGAITTVLETFERLPERGDGTAAAVALPVLESGFGSGVSGMPAHDDWQTSAALLLGLQPDDAERVAGAPLLTWILGGLGAYMFIAAWPGDE